jgi:phosphoglycolate phosphatase-like HAD superfamily hydrolase
MDVRDVAVVGDTVRDLEAGWNAGVAFRVAVLTGAHDRATLRAAPHTHIVESVADVPSIWLGSRTM